MKWPRKIKIHARKRAISMTNQWRKPPKKELRLVDIEKKNFLTLLTLANFRNHTYVISVVEGSTENTIWNNTEIEDSVFSLEIRTINQDNSNVNYANQVCSSISSFFFCFSPQINRVNE